MSFIRSFQIYVFPIILVIELIGNGLSFAVITRKSLCGQVASFYIALLAVLDSISLAMGIGPKWILALFGVDIISSSQAACKIWNFGDYWVSDGVNWIVSLIALDRFINIIFPHKTKEWTTLKRSIWMSFSILLFLLLINVQVLFFQTLVNHNDTRNETHFQCGFINAHAFTVFSWIDLACFCVIPFAVIISCNVAIICKVYVIQSRSVENKDTSITVTLI